MQPPPPIDAPVPPAELESRMRRFRVKMDATSPGWRLALFVSKVNLYYFTGSMQEGLLLIPREGDAVFWVRRDFSRARDESAFPHIRPMESYRDAAAGAPKGPLPAHLETEVVPLAMFQRMKKAFGFAEALSLDYQISVVRSLKSPFELAIMERAGQMHRRVAEERLPGMLREGMSEAELGVAFFAALMEEGHQGIARFAAFQADVCIGQINFGESSLYPGSLNSPGGGYGIGPYAPMMGSRHRRLKKGDLVFVDTAVGVEGYHTDKTVTYVFGGAPPPEAVRAHMRCLEIFDAISEQLRPGAVPSEIYSKILKAQTPEFLENFMGFGPRRAKFLGHGIGLVVDEWPVISEGFDEPLQEGMTLAVEPKKGVAGFGLVGIENTLVVAPNGGRNLTGPGRGLIPV